MALVKKGPFFMAFYIAIKFELSLVITFMAFYDCVRTLNNGSRFSSSTFTDTVVYWKCTIKLLSQSELDGSPNSIKKSLIGMIG